VNENEIETRIEPVPFWQFAAAVLLNKRADTLTPPYEHEGR